VSIVGGIVLAFGILLAAAGLAMIARRIGSDHEGSGSIKFMGLNLTARGQTGLIVVFFGVAVVLVVFSMAVLRSPAPPSEASPNPSVSASTTPSATSSVSASASPSSVGPVPSSAKPTSPSPSTSAAASPSLSAAPAVDPICRDTIDIDGVKPNTRYTLTSPFGILGTDHWVGDPRQVWLFITGSDGVVFTYGAPASRELADGGARQIWAAWNAILGAQGPVTLNVRLLTAEEGDAIVAAIQQSHSYKQDIPADAEKIIDIPAARNC